MFAGNERVLVLNFFRGEKCGFLSQKVNGIMIFTDY